MKIWRCLPFLALLALTPGHASIFETLRVAESNFTFTVNDSPLRLSSQGISLRPAVKEFRETNHNAPDTVNVVAYREYHLELAYVLDFLDRSDFSSVEFYQGNDRLHTINLQESGRVMSSSAMRRYDLVFIAVNLEGMPLIALDSVDRVNFVKAR